MICPIIYAALLSTIGTGRDMCRGPTCALWLPEIKGTPANATGRGNCSHNPTAPPRKPEE